MDISEVHKRVHLELEENVSAKPGGGIKVLSYVSATVGVQSYRDAFCGKPLLCVGSRFLVLTLIEVEQRSRSEKRKEQVGVVESPSGKTADRPQQAQGKKKKKQLQLLH